MQRATPQDFSRVLSSMCTKPHPVAREAAERFLATNPGDPGTYETVAKLERQAVAKLGEIAGLEDAAGYISSGGTEANIQAVRIGRNRKSTRNPNFVAPASAHFSFHKAADVLGVEMRVAPLDDYTANLDGVAELIDEDTVLVVGIAGTTEYGRVDPIPRLARMAKEVDALMHVDAAWGGFVLPFTHHEWDFSDADIDTMTIDPHKMGQAAVPAGGLLARGPELLDELSIDTPYLESTSQVTLTGTRSGAGVASAAAVMNELWPDGYREQYETSQSNADWLAAELHTRDIDHVDPTLPIVAMDLAPETIAALREEGWRISPTEAGEARIVMMPHVTRETLRGFLADVDRLR
ncbi:tyrosine decarboxylase MfnA [Halorarius litoreus]|uniref:tyrosine decarboxylase MfnA n=1 Tax=Halorarius litoreus TaxID=2962676 RepID=UPI0020CFBCEB|nr:tyrosine decarboxylase MfnA [Halorarius litoreus]